MPPERNQLTFSVKCEKLYTMKTLEDFGIGNCVNVAQKTGDLFDHGFTGHVVEVNDEYIVVEDQDGDRWDCDPDQLEHSSDDIMHRNL